MFLKRKLSSGLVWVVLFSLLFSWYCTTAVAQNVSPAIAEKIPKVDTSFGDIRVDNYFWLRDKNNPEVIKYLQAENKYTETVMKPTEKLQEKLYLEMLSRIKETDLSVPEKIDDYFYYTREEKGKQYKIYCRKKGSLDAKEEILLDANELAKGHNYLDVGVYKVNPDHQLLAYSIDTTGAEDFTLYFKDLNTGKVLADVIPNTSYSAEWANDNKTVYYNTLDEAKRPYKLYRHTLDTDPKNDALVYHEKDEAFNLDLKKSKSKAYLFMVLESETTSEDWYLDASHPDGDFKIIQPRQHEMEYSVEQHGDKFYILTNDNAKNFKLIEAPIDNPSKENWKEVIPPADSVKLDNIEVFKNHLVVYERERGLKKIRITNLTDNQVHYVDFPEPVYTFWPERNPDFNTNLLRFDYTSLITPRSVFDYDMDKRTRELKKQDEVLGGYNPSLYQSERVFVKASDGTLVPISLVYKKGMARNGKNPLFLYGYGAYGISSESYFSSNRLSLLDRGFIYAIAQVRGGGEMGRYWYEQGKLLNKKNTFTDFIACAEHLIAEKYTSKDDLVINGGSAGGLLMGAVTNMRPDLFKAVIADVPFVDLINTMLDPSLPLTVIEYEEWGNPQEKEYYEYMRPYSPYDNIQAKAYPNILITTSLNDPRVSYWEPSKWTAKLRALKTDDNLLLLKINMGAGHGGSSGRYDYLKDIALEYAFIFKVLGIKN
ncbi:MAG: S9 family peptidase [candidate division Zixibacteria bacterium]|nr:S9 family peptidase [candidate division Zixibacteria bacterium]